ncbi:MAG: hypothetical protein N4A50_14745 [Vallitalea sp.]|jgi:hypothetical protein|nr:hypothetical protein [Vallitalea sp.]
MNHKPIIPIIVVISLIVIIIVFTNTNDNEAIVNNDNKSIAQGILKRMRYEDTYDVSEFEFKKNVVLNGVTIILFKLPDRYWLVEMFQKGNNKLLIGGISSINNDISYRKIDSKNTSYLIVYGKKREHFSKIEAMHNEKKYIFDVEDKSGEVYFDYIDIGMSNVEVNRGDYKIIE